MEAYSITLFRHSSHYFVSMSTHSINLLISNFKAEQIPVIVRSSASTRTIVLPMLSIIHMSLLNFVCSISPQMLLLMISNLVDRQIMIKRNEEQKNHNSTYLRPILCAVNNFGLNYLMGLLYLPNTRITKIKRCKGEYLLEKWH